MTDDIHDVADQQQKQEQQENQFLRTATGGFVSEDRIPAGTTISTDGTVTINNDNPNLQGSPSGSWQARLGPDGNTYYYNTVIDGPPWVTDPSTSNQVFVAPDENGNMVPYHGPVNVIGDNLYLAPGATVDGATVTSYAQQPTVTVNAGATLENSQVYDGYLHLITGGTSNNNFYYATNATYYNIGGKSTNDTFIDPPSTGGGQSELSGYNPHQGNVEHHAFTPTSILNGNHVFTIASGGSFGGQNQDFPDFNNYVLSNNAPNVHTPDTTWTTFTKPGDPKTYYTSDGGKTLLQVNGQDYSGPVNFIDTSFTVAPYTTADGVNMVFVDHNPTLTVETNGTLQNSMAGNGTLIIEEGGHSKNNSFISEGSSIHGTSENDSFYEPGSGTAQATLDTNYPGATKFTLSDGVGDIHVYNTGKLIDPYIWADNGGSISVQPEGEVDGGACFLKGTLIKTVKGLVAVEDIAVGDELMIHTADGEQGQSVIWTGSRHCRVNTAVTDDMAGYPVRIVKDALGPNVPFKDMLITSEHCLYLNDQFVPVRMLVNGYSIHYDHTLTEYEYYHVELDNHAVIIADGVLTESYLNTGNHNLFNKNDKVVSLKRLNPPKSWEKDAAAPLTTAREIIEPLHQQYVERARNLGVKRSGFDSCSAEIETTSDMNLYLESDQGHILYAQEQPEKGFYKFILPAGARTVYIHSRSSRLCDAIGPYVDDRRNLGVLVGQVSVDTGYGTQTIRHHLDDRQLMGWNNIETIPYRWTDGRALLPLHSVSSDQPQTLIIQIVAGGPYTVEYNNNDTIKHAC